jgi:hypothetical protein
VNMPISVYARVPWYGTDGFNEGLKIVSSVILASVLIWPLLPLFRRVYKVPEPVVSCYATAARWTAGIAALILLVFVYFLEPYAMSDPGIILPYIYPGPTPPLLVAICTLPVIALLLALVCIGFAALAWNKKYWAVPHRVHYTLVTAALLAMLWWVITSCLWVFCL